MQFIFLKQPNRPPVGASLVEVIVAIALFGLFATALVGLLLTSYDSGTQAAQRDQAVAYAQEGLEAARSIRRQAWNLLENGQHGLSTASGFWEFSGTSDSLADDRYTRVVTIQDVCRDVTGAVLDCGQPGASIDVRSKLASVAVAYSTLDAIPVEINMATLLTNWPDQEFIQTDWSGGSGQAIWSNPARYESDDANVDVATPGQVKLAAAGEASWIPSSGNSFTDSTDTDFNAGTFSGSALTGSGAAAQVALDQAQQWNLHTDTGGETWYDVLALAPDNVWAVGSSGRIQHYNGSTWSLETDLGSGNIYTIAAHDANAIWAAGSSGRIYFYNGTSWNQIADTGNQVWYDLSVVSPTDIWGGGNSGRILHFNGSTWSQVADVGSSDILGIQALSASSVYAVAENGEIYSYNGSSWSLLGDTGNADLNDIFLFSSTVGAIVADNGLIYYSADGGPIQVTDLGGDDIWAVDALAPDDIWAAGQSGKIYHFNGSAWSEFTDTGSHTWYGLSMLSPTSGWAVGTNGLIFEYGVQYVETGTFTSRVFDGGSDNVPWNGIFWTETLPAGSNLTVSTRTGPTPTPDASWSSFSSPLTNPTLSQITSPPNRYFQYRVELTRAEVATQTPLLDDLTILYNSAVSVDLKAVSAVGANDVWAIGDDGVIAHFNGSTWSEFTDVGNVEFNDIAMVSATDGWAVAENGLIYRYNGSVWAEFTDVGSTDLNTIWMHDATTGWIGGDSGRIYQFLGGSWQLNIDMGPRNIFGLDGLSQLDVWAVAAQGEIYHYDGVSWSEVADTGNQTWYDLAVVTADNIWLVGNSGRVGHFNGSAWVEVEDFGNMDWRSVVFSSPDNGWMFGGNGEVYMYDGVNWSQFIDTGDQTWYGATLIGTTDGWAVGSGGSLLRYQSGGGFAASGNLTSSAYFMGGSASVHILDWNESNPCAGCDIQFQVRTAPDNGGTPGSWTDWSGSGGSGTYFTNPTGELISTDLNFNDWAQYRLELTGNGNDSPVLNGVRIYYLP